MKKRDFVIKVLRYIIYDSSYKKMTLKLIA